MFLPPLQLSCALECRGICIRIWRCGPSLFVSASCDRVCYYVDVYACTACAAATAPASVFVHAGDNCMKAVNRKIELGTNVAGCNAGDVTGPETQIPRSGGVRGERRHFAAGPRRGQTKERGKPGLYPSARCEVKGISPLVAEETIGICALVLEIALMDVIGRLVLVAPRNDCVRRVTICGNLQVLSSKSMFGQTINKVYTRLFNEEETVEVLALCDLQPYLQFKEQHEQEMRRAGSA